jgi:hypothetical protein
VGLSEEADDLAALFDRFTLPGRGGGRGGSDPAAARATDGGLDRWRWVDGDG